MSLEIDSAADIHGRIGHGRHVMSYTIASGKSFNMVLSHMDDSPPETWSKRDAIQDMRQSFRDWDPRYVNRCSHRSCWAGELIFYQAGEGDRNGREDG